MKVLIADKLSDTAVAGLSSGGHEVVSLPKVSGDELAEAVRDEQPQVLVVRSTKVPASVMDAGRALELIVRAGAGYDNIDVQAASERGIFVSNCPAKNSAAVAELTMGLLLALDRRIPDNVRDAREGQWKKAEYSQSRGIKGMTLGVIGTGSIGREVIRRALAFDVNVVAWSRSLTDEVAEELGVTRKESPVEVASASNAVTLHVASTPETKHLANAEFFEAMWPASIFINTSRSSIVDEDALLRAVEEKDIFAAIDVMENEPAGKEGAFEHPLAGHPRIYMTHHIGASTGQAQEAIALEAVRVMLAYDETGKPPNCVNLAERTPATHLLTVRHLDRVGVLAGVLDEVRKANWNVQEMDNLVFEGARAAFARIRFDGTPDDEVLQRINAQENVLAATLISL